MTLQTIKPPFIPVLIDDPKFEGKFERNGCTFEIAKQPDGVWWLLLWLSPGSSVRIGVHANPEVAMYQADNLPKDFDVRRTAMAPVGGFGFAEGV